jgi:hypothetical protein
MENTPFGGFSAGLRCLNLSVAGAEILVFGGLAAIFAKFDFVGLLNRQLLRPKGQATPHANFAALHLSVAEEWDRLAAVQIHKTCRSFRCRR